MKITGQKAKNMGKLEESWTDRDVHPLLLKKNHRPEV
jgi:hypothetical protein